MNDHTMIEELTAVRVLGGLDDADFRLLDEQLTAHRPDCAECRSIQDSYSEVAGRIGFALNPRPLEESAETRILESILGGGEQGAVEPIDIHRPRRSESSPGETDGREPRTRPRTWVRVVAAGVAAAVLLVGGVGLGYLTLPRTTSSRQALGEFLPGASVTSFSATNGGQLEYASKAGSPDVFVWGSGLRPPPPGHVYQLWTISGKTPSPGPTFVPENGTAVVHMQTDLADSQVMAVTIEPVGGSMQPTTTPIFTAPINA